MNTVELKPCPFCQKEAVADEFVVRCTNNCTYFFSPAFNRTEENERAESWNRLPDRLEKMEPCPFCGSNNVRLCQEYGSDATDAVKCRCWTCGATQVRHFIEAAEEAVARWNERAGGK